MASQFPIRKSPRAYFHDYSGGDYFVTICTHGKRHYFGEIRNSEIWLTVIGKIAVKEIEELQRHFPYAKVPLFVVMPNHIHMIVSIKRADAPTGTDAPTGADAPVCVPTRRTALSVVIGCFKQAVTMFARRNGIDFGWQGRYHDHIIRGTRDRNMISDYILNNVAKWDADCFNPKKRSNAAEL